MTVEIEKLRALCAEVPESLTVDCRGDVVVGVDGIAAERTGVHPVGSLFPLVLRSPRGDCDSLAVAELAAAARPAILALCDRVERAEVEVERLRTTRPASDMDIEKLRALCAEATPHPLTLEPGSHGRWRITVTVDGHTAEIAHGNDYHHEDGPLFAKAREIILAMCDRVERADAEIERLRAAVAAAHCAECNGAGAFAFGRVRLDCVHCRPARERADVVGGLQAEVERLRAENARLRAENTAMRASMPDGCAKCSFDAAAWGPPVMESVTADSPESLWWVEGTITVTVRVELRGVEVSAASEAEAIETAIEKYGVDGDVVSHTLTVTSLAPEVTP